MFYPQQYLSPTEPIQFQEEQQQRRELELLKQQLIQQTLLLNTPPPSPMSATLGHPNRSCASCKKRKVKCDRKTPSCTACQKSKHQCRYTSYAPPTFSEEQQHPDEDENLKAIKQRIEELDNNAKLRWEHFQKVMSVYQQQPAMTPKVNNNELLILEISESDCLPFESLSSLQDEFGNSTSASSYYNIDEEEAIYNLNLNNPVISTTNGGSPFLQGSPQQLQLSPQHHQLQVPAQPPQTYMLPQQYQQRPNPTSPPFVQTQNIVMPSGNYSPYMSGTIVLNYNLNAMRSLLGRNVAPILQSMTGGQGPAVPPTGFNDVGHLQNWLREKFLNQDWSEEMETYSVVDPDERFELRPIYEDVSPHNQNNISVRQKFEVVLHRSEYVSSPSSVHGGDFQTYDYDDKHSMEMENLTNYSETGSNRSSVADFDPTDIFLNKIYAFVRRFIRNLPWLRENFLANWRRSPDTFNDGVFSDVVVEVRKISSYSPYQDLKLVQNNEEFIKGRLFF